MINALPQFLFSDRYILSVFLEQKLKAFANKTVKTSINQYANIGFSQH